MVWSWFCGQPLTHKLVGAFAGSDVAWPSSSCAETGRCEFRLSSEHIPDTWALVDVVEGFRFFQIGACSSTQSEVKAFVHSLGPSAMRPGFSGVALLAHRQTEGKGRRGRAWHDTAGGLAISFFFPERVLLPVRAEQDRKNNSRPSEAVTGMRPTCAEGSSSVLLDVGRKLALGLPVAVIQAISIIGSVTSPHTSCASRDHGVSCGSRPAFKVRIGWPNDFLIGSRKCGGMLIEVEEGLGVFAGVGINLVTAPDLYRFGEVGTAAKAEPRLQKGEGSPSSLRSTWNVEGDPSETSHEERVAGREAASLADIGVDTTASALGHMIVLRVVDLCRRMRAGLMFSALTQEWLGYAAEIGQRLCVRSGSQALTGTFVGLSNTGSMRLRLKETNQIVDIHAADWLHPDE